MRSSMLGTASPRIRVLDRSNLNVTTRSPRSAASTPFKRSTFIRASDRTVSNQPKEARRSGGELKVIGKKLDNLLKNTDNSKLEKTEHRLLSTNEELQATLVELEQTRTLLASADRKYGSAMKKIERLEEENRKQAAELDQILAELVERRRKSMSRRVLEERQNGQSPNRTITLDDEADMNVEKLVVEQTRQRVEELEEQLHQMNITMTDERKEYRAMATDLLTAVRVAQTLKEEAQAEVARWKRATQAREVEEENDWLELMKKFDRNSKRNSLLAWAQSRLTAYPSLCVSNFSFDWSDGKAICALVHSMRPELLNRMDLQTDCVQRAADLATSLDIKDLDKALLTGNPDWKTVMDVVFQLYRLGNTPTV